MASARKEAERILALAKGDTLKAYEMVERQLSVLVLRTQVILSLSGIVITVTGFSGRAIAQTSNAAASPRRPRRRECAGSLLRQPGGANRCSAVGERNAPLRGPTACP
jgi:hypothetical protein